MDTAYRVVADHIRTLCVAIADGATVSNEGRGYVLRRILRRAVRYGRQKLGAGEGFFVSLVPAVVDSLGGAFPELVQRQAEVTAMIADEEAAFSSMLSRGVVEFGARADAAARAGAGELSGDDAFFLYDTMGFPLDLTTLMAAEQGLGVDAAGFEGKMAEQRARSAVAAAAAKGAGGALGLSTEGIAALVARGVAPSDDDDKFAWEVPAAPSTLKALVTSDGLVDVDGPPLAAADDAVAGLVLDTTPFYAEAGGQVADTGILRADGVEFAVDRVQKFGGFALHVGRLTKGELGVGAALTAEVDYERRRKVAPNHTFTHVLHEQLARVLGAGVAQRGSLVDADKLRFDFSHNSAMKVAELAEVESRVQAAISDGLPVYDEVVPLADAKAIGGLRALFGEAYPDPVRVVSIGVPVSELLAADGDERHPSCESVELCGGTHVTNTADARAFAILEETAVAKGIRRVTCVTDEAAEAAIARGVALRAQLGAVSVGGDADSLGAAKEALGAFKSEIDAAPASAHVKAELRAELAAREKEIAGALRKIAGSLVDAAAAAAVDAASAAAKDGRSFVAVRLADGIDSKGAQSLIKKVGKAAPGVALLGLSTAADGGRLSCFAAVPADLQQKMRADEWLRAALEPCGGRGGGKPGQAQGTGPDVGAADDALEAARSFARDALGGD